MGPKMYEPFEVVDKIANGLGEQSETKGKPCVTKANGSAQKNHSHNPLPRTIKGDLGKMWRRL